MRKLFMLAFMLIVGAVWGFSIAEYLSPNESAGNVTYLDMVGPDGAYVVYYLNNEPMMMVHDGKIVHDNETVKVVLEQYYFKKDFPNSEELTEIINTALEFNESRKNVHTSGLELSEPPEKMCWRYTGLVVRRCDINEEEYHPCRSSCGASPICKGSILEGGITSAEHSTTDFLDSILSFQTEVDGIDTDINTIVSVAERLKGLEYSEFSSNSLDDLSHLIDAAKNINMRYEKMEGNILFKDLLEGVSGLQSYCAPLNYSSEAADKLKVLANMYDARTADLYSVDEISDEIINRTLYREQLKVHIEAENKYNARFNAMDAKYSDLYTKYVKTSKYVNDSSLKDDIETLKKKKDSARDDIYKGNFSKADLTIKQFDILAANFDAKIGNYFNETSKIEELQGLAEKKIIIAEWDVGIDNLLFGLGQQLNDVKMRKSALDTKIAGKLLPEELGNVTQQYADLVAEIDEIIQTKRDHAFDALLGEVVSATNTYSNTLASTYTSVTGGNYQQRKQVRDFVFPATLVMVDLVAIGAFIAAFIYMVASGRVRLHRIAAMMWSLIFIAFFTAVAGGSIASYLLINEKINKASFDTFYFELLAANETAVVVDERAGEVSDKCATMLTGLFNGQMNKTVYVYRYGLDGCELKEIVGGNSTNSTTTSKMSVDVCDEQLERMPRVTVRKADNDSTTFAVKCSVSTLISGSDEYMEQCKLGVILDEVVK